MSDFSKYGYQSVSQSDNVVLTVPSQSSSSSSSSSHHHQPKLNAREAYIRGDVQASIAYHQHKLSHSEVGHSDSALNDYIKSIVYGGLDGIITTFATVTSVAGSNLSPVVIVVLGLAHLVADGLAMGMGDYLSTAAEMDFNNTERRRERWEMDNNLSGEVEEMIELYERKGIPRHDAEIILTTLAKYPDAFLDHMMVEELGLMPIDGDESPLKSGIVTMLSFMIFGSIPLLPYLINLLPSLSWSASTQLSSAVIMTMFTLFLLGAIKGKMVDMGRKWFSSAMQMTLNGSFAALVGYFIGVLLNQLLDIQPGTA